MKIKIGNFNFINKNENILIFDSYTISHDLFDYFYIDGKEDTLYVSSTYNFDRAKKEEYKNISEFNFERDLLKKYKVISYSKEALDQINSFIKQKSEEIFKSQNYSRYDLYNNISLNEIFYTNKNSEFVFESSYNVSFDFDNNKINMGDFIFNPYLEKIENLEEMYREGKFDKQIKANLINLELENNIEPKFVEELIKIDDFLKDKKSVNILLKDCEKSKVEPHISYILELKGNNIALNWSWSAKKDFEKANPNKNIKDLKLEDLQGLSYGKQVLEINPDNLMDLRKQIAINPEDKLLFKIDELKEKLEDKFRKYGNDLYIKDRAISNQMPYTLEGCLNEITKIDVHNNKLDTKEEKKYPDWYSKDLEKMFEENDLLTSLIEANSIEEIQCIAEHLEDEELVNIVDELKEENFKTEEDEEEF